MEVKSGIEGWHEADGDNTFALNWDLSPSSEVWEIGGFEGRWAQQIYDKFSCNITIFEPQLWACMKLMQRFSGNQKISIRPYGLWIHDAVLPIGNYYTDGASVVKDDGREEKQLGAFLDIEREIDTMSELYESLCPIDLALMNIEGGEYFLLPYMIEKRLMEGIDYFWCQFHPDDLEYHEKIEWNKISDGLSRTHEIIWNFYPTAVAWRRK